jgi:ABC-type multidrug transport system fused ATPase/permease subunit
MRALAKTYGAKLFLGVALYVICFACQLVNAELQARIIDYIGDSSVPVSIGVVFAVSLFVSSVISTTCHQFSCFYMDSLGLGINMTCLGLLYDKVQNVSLLTQKGKAAGNAINFAGSGLENLDNLS